ncbi:B3 domain-containing transcription repressor VAL1-like [Actinidia eriantha]|uniref:B3 domain-containing transcription repressor VAL1-like n=1 Tax=Actinidia eriantha TaxID=165200 RepID=UPI00258FB0D4|nr:B3 domain-containing transcription repressor VAL1-like [Actinidia eriantha]
MEMICMNEVCHTTTTLEWKKGWGLKSGGFATLCYNCGTAYEDLVYCETFHLQESGWRECKLCGKHIHCGCIASKYLHEYLDFGGICCITCAKSLVTHSIRPIQIPNDDIPNGFRSLTANNIEDPQPSYVAISKNPSYVENRMGGISLDKGKRVQLCKTMDAKELSPCPQRQRSNTNGFIGKTKRDEIKLPIGEVGLGFPNLIHHSVGSSTFAKLENSRQMLGANDIYASLAQPSLDFALGTSLDTSNSVFPSSGVAVDGREQNKSPHFQQDQRTRPILPKPSKSGLAIGLEANKGMVSQIPVARPPAEGRGRTQLLPRYWPRITDQELQQISGDLNSTIVPLFEKVLSASDAGRIGRLVLPKACAEAYFPSISQSEGIPIRIQDIKGKEWTFQFRFWPNNNSRMYVLEGVTPCIQNMNLQAGDTVIFSRIDPGGKLVMGFRKASNSVDMQDSQTSTLPNGAPTGETSLSGAKDTMPSNGSGTNEDSSQWSMLMAEKKTRKIGSKSKRLLMHSKDTVELRLTWNDAQELLRPSPSAKPTIVMVEGHEFEEYNEPPVFGKRTIFTARASGEREQWAQCDSCCKWRRLPVDFLLPPKWTCSDNIGDSSRCSCSAPDEMNPKELESLLRVGKDFKKRRITESPKVAQERELSGLDALATAAVLGADAGDSGNPSEGATTKHPRHRPGCTCIVCIQPPSGKGRHKATCICNVCLTVRRRFKTLKLRRKKLQAEREAEIAKGKQPVPPKEGSKLDGGMSANASPNASPHPNSSEDERSENKVPKDKRSTNKVPKDLESSKGQLDLNFHPNRDDDLPVEAAGLSMTSLVRAARLPLDVYLRESGLPKLGPCLLSQAASESDGGLVDEGCVTSLVGKLTENEGDER